MIMPHYSYVQKQRRHMTAEDEKGTVSQPLSQALACELTLHLQNVRILALVAHLPCRHENDKHRHESLQTHSAAGGTECAVRICCDLEQPFVGSASVIVL